MLRASSSISDPPSVEEKRPSLPISCLSHLSRRQILRGLTASGVALVGGSALIGCSNSADTTVNVTFVTANWPTDSLPSAADQKSDPTKKAYADTLNKWLKNNPGVKIQHSALNIWDTPGLTSAIAAGTAPTWYMGDILGSFSKLNTRTAFVKGLAADITALVQQYDLMGQLNDWIVPAYKGWNINGKYYGTPAGSGVGNGVFYRRDQFQEAGLPDPTVDWTWDDFRRYAKALTKGSVKGVSMPSYGYGEGLVQFGLLSDQSAYTLRGIIPQPNQNWHWSYDILSLKDEYIAYTNLWRGMLYDDKSMLAQGSGAGDGDVVKALIRGDVMMASANTASLTGNPNDPANVHQVATRLNKTLDEVVGYISLPRGNNGALGMTQVNLAVGSINPRLQKNQAQLAKAFDFLVYMTMGQGMIDQAVGSYNATKNLVLAYPALPAMTKNQVKIPGVPGTIEDAYGPKMYASVNAVGKIPLVPDPANYFQEEKNSGMTSQAFTDAASGLGFTQDDITGILTNLQNTLNQQATSLSSSISSTDFLSMTKKFYTDLDKFWQTNVPDYASKYFHPWYEQKILPKLK